MSRLYDAMHALADESSQTKGGSFIITFVSGSWKINFNNAGEVFDYTSLVDGAEAATDWLRNSREEIVPSKKLYKIIPKGGD